ncbi:hypothetical protein ACLHDF_23430 [Priestia aryabhattai]|uniref:capsular polysaccharide export protein, LipB/KpsS family n=1 Tax=Priestia megaterium TaxID=1404 RepID=UPI0039B8D39F
MNRTYLLNYWTLYTEFIDKFKNLKFKGVPLALMTNFYQQIDEELKRKMEHEDFKKLFLHQITSPEQIQPFFEHWLNPLRKPLISNPTGKILINSAFIKIPEKTMTRIFHKDNAIILSNARVLNQLGLPNEYIGKYKENTKKDSDSLITEATNIFSDYEDHPAFGNDFFRKVFIERIPMIVETIATVFNIYKKHQTLSVVVGTTEDIVSRTLVIVASMLGIPSICLQHGILMGEEAYLPAFASYMAVYGEYEKKWYEERGLSNNRISVIGHPRYDLIFTEKHLSKQFFVKQFKIDPHKLTLLIATGPHLDLRKFGRLIDLIATNSKYQIIIKPHPWEIGKGKYNFYLKLKSRYKSIEVITNRSVNTYDLLSNVDGVLTSLSTMALEGLLFNKPVFIYDFINNNRNRSYDYYESFDRFIQSDPDILVNVLNNYYSDPNENESFNNMKNQFLATKYKVKNAGKSLSNLIYELANIRSDE